MSAAQLFDWPTARAALNAGWRVRRGGWTDRWLERWNGGLIWLIFDDGTKRVVQNTDFGASEFAALDWTNLPASCITAGTTAGTGTNGCPLPYTPPVVTPGQPVTPDSPSTPVPADQPPTGAPGAGQVGAGGTGGGGGGGGGGNGPNIPPRDPQNMTWPTLSLSMTTEESDCYQRPSPATDFIEPIFMGTVALSHPDNYNGPNIFWVSVKVENIPVVNVNLGPGGSYGIEWTSTMQWKPGTTVTFVAHAWANGSPDMQASVGVKLPDWCPPCECDGGTANTWYAVPNIDPETGCAAPDISTCAGLNMSSYIGWARQDYPCPCGGTTWGPCSEGEPNCTYFG